MLNVKKGQKVYVHVDDPRINDYYATVVSVGKKWIKIGGFIVCMKVKKHFKRQETENTNSRSWSAMLIGLGLYYQNKR